MSYENKFISVVIAAAGMGKRMKSETNKQYILLKDQPILAHTINKFEENGYIDEIILTVREGEIDYCKKQIVEKYGFKKVKEIVVGGEERQDSVYNGLKKTDKRCDVVLIHDGARPFIRNDEIEMIIKNTLKYRACVTGVRVKDTIKLVDNNNDIIDTPNRENLWAVHTPQSFDYKLIVEAHRKAKNEKWMVTDDSSLVEKLGIKVKMIEGSYDNIKITTPEDLFISQSILEKEDKI